MPRLSILNVAYPFAEVSADTAGGAEQIVYALDRQLTEAGHRSFVLARAGSELHGELIAVPVPERHADEHVRQGVWTRYREELGTVLTRENIDLVHLHGLDFDHYVPTGRVPVLATLHLPPAWYPSHVFRPQPNVWLSCVSLSQRAECPSETRVSFVVENGVDVERLRPRAPTELGDYVLCLGRICPEKGFHLALDAAAGAGLPCLLAGAVYPYPEHERYFEQEIRPRQSAERRFIGPVGFEQKRRLLARARCLVIPSLVAETSSLVAMEAWACGTPVVAMRRGALPELVKDGVTGFLCDDVEEMTAALRRIDELDRHACRTIAEQRFDVRRMATDYTRLYERLLRDASASAYRAAPGPDPAYA